MKKKLSYAEQVAMFRACADVGASDCKGCPLEKDNLCMSSREQFLLAANTIEELSGKKPASVMVDELLRSRQLELDYSRAQDRIRDLEAQLPKIGYWIKRSPEEWECPNCGSVTKVRTCGVDNFDHDPLYCSNCGVRLR